MRFARMQELLIDALKTEEGGALAQEIGRRRATDAGLRRAWRLYVRSAGRQADAVAGLLGRKEAAPTARRVARARAEALIDAMETELYGGKAVLRVPAECADEDEAPAAEAA